MGWLVPSFIPLSMSSAVPTPCMHMGLFIFLLWSHAAADALFLVVTQPSKYGVFSVCVLRQDCSSCEQAMARFAGSTITCPV